MNPITNAKNQNLMNVKELSLGYTGTVSSWHRQYKDSAWIYIGGLNYDLTEGDVICVFSQYGEVVNINLVRDGKTGVSKGFAFLCYEDQRSTVLAIDNLNGIKLANRIIRVDHVEKYKVPSEGTVEVFDGKKTIVPKDDAIAQFVKQHGCGPDVMKQIKHLQQKNNNKDRDEKETVRHHSVSKSDKKHDKHKKRDRKSPKKDRLSHRSRNPSPSPPRKKVMHRESSSPQRPIRLPSPPSHR